MAGAKDDRRDARVAAAGLRTDPHLFRPVQVGDPAVIELREWSRLAEELQQERLRLANRIRQQLWRYYPQLLALSDDLAAEWILELWSLAPTPAEAARLSEATLEPLLRRHRIRRLDAAGVLGVLRRPAIAVAAGVTEAAVLHLRSLLARLRLANAEFCQAERKVDELCAALSRHAAAEPAGPCDADILRSLPGIGTVILAILLTEARDPLARRDYAALRTLSGVAPVTKRSGKTRIVVMRYAAHVRACAGPCSTGPAWPSCATRTAEAAMRPCGNVAIPTAAPCAASPTGCWGSPAATLRRQVLFDPDHGVAEAA